MYVRNKGFVWHLYTTSNMHCKAQLAPIAISEKHLKNAAMRIARMRCTKGGSIQYRVLVGHFA